MVVSGADEPTIAEAHPAVLEHLGSDERRTLAYGSAIGHEFDFPLLVAAISVEDEVLAEQLERLTHLGILRESAGGDRFGFVDEASRTWIYQALSASRLRVIHRKIAEAMERLHPEPPAEIIPELSRHYFLGRVPQKSYDYNRRAAELARADDLPEVAAHHLERARIDLPSLPGDHSVEESQLAGELGELYYRSGDFQGAARLYQESLDDVPADRPDLRARVLLAQAELARDLAHSDDALRHAREARRLFNAHRDAAGIASVHRIEGRIAFERGAYFEALDEALTAQEILEQVGNTDLLGRVAIDLGNAYRALGPDTRDESLRAYDRAVPLLTEAGDWPEVARAYLNRALLTGWDRPGAALEDLARGKEFAERAHEPRWMAWTLVSGVEFRLLVGQVEEAERDNQLAQRLFERSDEPRGIQQTRLNAGILAERRGRWEEAEKAYGEAIDHARRLKLPAEEAEATFHLAGLFYKTRDFARAREVYRDARHQNLPRLCPWLASNFATLGRQLDHDPSPPEAVAPPLRSETR